MRAALHHSWSLLLGVAIGLLTAALVSFASGGRFGYVYLALGGLFTFISLGVALVPAGVDARTPDPARMPAVTSPGGTEGRP